MPTVKNPNFEKCESRFYVANRNKHNILAIQPETGMIAVTIYKEINVIIIITQINSDRSCKGTIKGFIPSEAIFDDLAVDDHVIVPFDLIYGLVDSE